MVLEKEKMNENHKVRRPWPGESLKTYKVSWHLMNVEAWFIFGLFELSLATPVAKIILILY